MLPKRATIALATLLLLIVAAAPTQARDKERIRELPQKYQVWLEEVHLLIAKEELATFLELEKDYQRDAFIERFWRIRDPYPDTARNEYRIKWDARIAEARREFGDLREERSEALLINGLPDARLQVDCAEVWPAEVWYYARAESLGHEFVLLFYQIGHQGRYRLWNPLDGLRVLLKFPGSGGEQGLVDQLQSSCGMQETDALMAALSMARAYGNLGFQTVIGSLLTPPEKPSGEWVATFNSYNTDLPDEASTFAAATRFEYPGRKKSRTVVQGVVSVTPDQVGVSDLAGVRTYNFVLNGEVLREDRLFDTFRFSYNIPVGQVGDGEIPLVFERYLRPGDYTLILKIEDLNRQAYFRFAGEIQVPRVERAVPSTPQDPESARLLAEANAAITSGETSISIVPPTGDLQTGLLRVDTLAAGDIAEVVFAMDDKPVLTKRNPPFNVELNLGSLPRSRMLSAVAYDLDGNEVARDEHLINSGSHRFAVRLVEPRRGRRYTSSLRAEAALEIPEGGVVERVEFYLNETLVASLYQPPWVQPIVLPSAEQVAYVRAVAYQPDGNSTEDLVFVNAPEYLEEVDVQFVELFVAVLDKQKRPVSGLELDDFQVLEDGVAQQPLRFDLVDNLPIHAGIVVDVSASMGDEAPAACATPPAASRASVETPAAATGGPSGEPSLLAAAPGRGAVQARQSTDASSPAPSPPCTKVTAAKQAALKFFQEAITKRDRATLITFNDHPNLTTKFTNDVQQLASGLAGLKAERGTALYDAVVFSLYYFNGIKGQRALILLSDGKDEHSRFSFDDTLEYARRAGVAIYTIGLELKGKLSDARRKLAKLAEETGGRGFFVDDAAELGAIYEAIQKELRSRYYIAYQSTNSDDINSFRTIEVEMQPSGLQAKTLRGYYP